MATVTADRPVIGYTVELDDPLLPHVEPALREPLERHGALALALPRSTPVDRIEQILSIVDGVQLSGGADVDPVHYGEDRHDLTRPIAAEQDAFEIELARRCLERGVPLLGICRGIQVLAVADGGKLTQDLETLHEGAGRHRYGWEDQALKGPGDHWHDITVEQGSDVERWLDGGPTRVNSFHHQCVAATGRRLRVTARGADGVVEAIERQDGDGFAAGLQWHNEMQWRHDERFLRPFADFAEAARLYRLAREAERVAGSAGR
jgi:putative glutamine amidotransferase